MYGVHVRAQDIAASASGMKNSIWGSGVMTEVAIWGELALGQCLQVKVDMT